MRGRLKKKVYNYFKDWELNVHIELREEKVSAVEPREEGGSKRYSNADSSEADGKRPLALKHP